MSELGIQQPSNVRHSQSFFNHEDPSLKSLTTTTNSYLDNTFKKNQIESSSSYNNFSFSIAKSQLKNMQHNTHTSINNSFTYIRSNSNTHTRIQKQIEDINKTLNNKMQPRGGNLHRPTFTEVNLDHKEYLNISPFNLRKGILSKATHTVVTHIGNNNGRNITNHTQQKSIFNFLLSKDKQGKIPLLNRKYLFENDNTETDDFYGGLVDQYNTKEKVGNGSQFKSLLTENNYLNKNKDKINKRSLSQNTVFNF